MFDNIKEDYRRILDPISEQFSGFKSHFYVVTNYGFLAIIVYRYGKYANQVRLPAVGQLLRVLYIFAKVFIEILFGISIDVNSNIGPGFYIGHFSGIIVHGNLGKNCTVGHGVTIGAKGAGKSNGWPEIGNNVFIGAGAAIIGNVKIGDNVVVGANTVVVNDIPENSLVVGAAPRILPKV